MIISAANSAKGRKIAATCMMEVKLGQACIQCLEILESMRYKEVVCESSEKQLFILVSKGFKR